MNLAKTEDEQSMSDDYLNIPLALQRAVKRGKDFLVVELYHHSVDDIFSDPSRAMFRYSTTNLVWQNCKYKGKLISDPTFDKFINKQFNSLTVSLLNVKAGSDRPSFVVLNEAIKGFRVSVRVIAEGLSIADSWSAWSGRLDSVTELTAEQVGLNCTQELGKFSYKLATDHYGSACPLRFGLDDCLGYETLAQKSPAYVQALHAYGHGGCNHTFERCEQLVNTKFYQGQRKLTTGGTFNRITYVKKRNWWTLGLTKKTKQVIVPVQWSIKSQDDNSSVIIPLAFGRVSAPSRTFTSADIGTQLVGLVGFIRPSQYGVEGFYAVKSADVTFPVISYTAHLGTLGGIGTQTPDARFLGSGYNSRLTYLGVTCADNSQDPMGDAPSEFPTISAIIKASLVPVFNGVGFDIMWTHNPIWITRYMMTSFRFTVIKDAWFNEFKNYASSLLCYKIVEDDSNADIATISNNEAGNFNTGGLVRYHSSSRVKENILYEPVQSRGASQNLIPRPSDSSDDTGDISFFPALQNSGDNLKKTFLQFQFTLNGMVNESASLSDVLYGLVFPVYRGYMAFDRYAKMFIGMRQPAPNAFVRVDTLGSNIEPRLPITNVNKLHNKGGYLLVGAGQINGEIRVERGVSYIHSPIVTRIVSTGGITISATNFVELTAAPSRSVLNFTGTPTVGSRIELSFTIPTTEGYHTLSWDWYVESSSLEAAVLMFMTRLQASPTFDEFWTVRVNQQISTQLILEYQAGYLILNKPLLKDHLAGEEVLRVVEVYENFKDPDNTDGRKDNIFEFSLAQGDDVYQSVKGTYISSIEDFTEVEILPYSAWATIEDEREMHLLELDLRMCDNYNQAAFIVKANYIDFVVGALYGNLQVPNLAMFHQEDDVIAVRYQTLEGAVSYLPMWVMALNKGQDSVSLKVKLYLSAMFDTRVPQEEKFLESTLTPLPINTTPILTPTGGYSSTRTGDGAADSPQDIIYRPKPYGMLPKRFHTDGSYSEMTSRIYDYVPKTFAVGQPAVPVSESVVSPKESMPFIPIPIKLNGILFDGARKHIYVTWSYVQSLNLATFEVEIIGVERRSVFVAEKELTLMLDVQRQPYTVRVRAIVNDSISGWSESITVSV